MILEKGVRYNFKNQPERLIYLGENWSGNGFWHQFALVDSPDGVWAEMLESDLVNIQETMFIETKEEERKGKQT